MDSIKQLGIIMDLSMEQPHGWQYQCRLNNGMMFVFAWCQDHMNFIRGLTGKQELSRLDT